MRIVAGQFRGRSLTPVGDGDSRAALRPTADRVREALFNMLAGGRFGDPFTGTRVLDLFAGTGALGLEALSRGAVHATFADSGRAAQKLITANVRLLGVQEATRLLPIDALRLPPAKAPCNLVFLDPPYGRDLGTKALARAREAGWIAPGALIVWEENAAQAAPSGFLHLDTRRYGDTHVTLLEAA